MEATCKIIRLKQGHALIANLMKENVEGRLITHGELEAVVTKARNVLDTMEEEWQENHNSLVLMEQFHLLRNYLDFIRRHYEGNL
jgi:hypothetical protein